MTFHGSIKVKVLGIFLSLMALALIVACGTSAPAPAAVDTAPAPAVKDAAPAAAPTPKPKLLAKADTSPKAAPTAVPKAAQPPVEVVKSEGTLNVGLKEMGPFFVHPEVMTNPQIFVQGTAPIGEGLLRADVKGNHLGNLAESWSISDDFLTWTFNLKKGVQFHKGYGEMTADDVLYSMYGFRLSKHPRAGNLENFWEPREGTMAVDDYTVQVNSGEPFVNVVAQTWFMVPAGSSSFIVSKKQSEELGVEAASQDIAATGPWEIVEHQTAEYWKMAAVQDHWRTTPAFAELVFWEIPEESSRIAGFQTGKLDTFLMNFDTIPLVESIEGARTMSIPNAVTMRNRIYGNWYPIEGVETRPGYDADLPWVSSSDDTTTADWARARDVRKALFMAMDRDTLVEEILSGYGHSNVPLSGHTNAMDLLEGRQLPDYDPEGAKKLLADAGYPDGFSITLTPSIRGAAAEVESCEIIAQYWNDIGLDVNFQRIPYGTLRPQLVARTYQGVTCHAGSIDPTPAAGYGSYLSGNPFNRGVEHQWMEDNMNAAVAEVDPVKRRALEKAVGIFLLDNYLTDLVYYTLDAVWPVGPRIEPWTENVNSRDLRQINGYEYIQHKR
jgi:peptide/nickel transport system substrate-binding protein